ncbi:uncharacterized protein LOC143203190 isoform X2 [Rhynchophorus ferrugineus]|uniref:uncharacterized protein LOC143203190 isoform X2 n=1 Tax=Rhynchophorus ferrugineus TaxID=354439 RepID=UPI003FCE2CCF
MINYARMKYDMCTWYEVKTCCTRLYPKTNYNRRTTKEVVVRVIGARQLPNDYGCTKAKGYVVKVTFFPSKEKFETKIARDTWPTINEDFTAHLNYSDKFIGDMLKGAFISFTIYAILDDPEEKKSPKSKNKLTRLLSLEENANFIRKHVHRSTSFRNSMTDRRTIGAVTYNLERKNFNQNIRDYGVSTPDVWRSIKSITSGIQTQPRESQKGSVEVTLQYSVSEDGTNDVIEVSVTKFRCSVQTMQEHERIGGQLYIKISAFESNDVIQKKKSDRFDPTISLRLQANTATLRATVNKYMLDQVKIVIRLLAKNFVGKKFVLGTIEIDKDDPFWKRSVAAPGVPETKMVHFN